MSSIRIEGDTQRLVATLRDVGNVDKRGILTAIGEGLRTSTSERFLNEESPEGKKWKTSFRASQGGKTLTDTAQLKNSIHVEVGQNGVAVGTNTIYAATHQLGASRTIRAKNSKYLRFKVNGVWRAVTEVKINIPERPFLEISEDDKKEIEETIKDAIERSI